MKEKWVIFSAFFCIYIIWGSTYLVNYIALQEMPPFLMAGSRFAVAGILMIIGLLLYYGRKIQKPTKVEIRNAILLGLVFITMGNGLVIQALAYIDSGITALIIAFDPLLIVLMMWAFQGIVPKRFTIAGMLLGTIGMLLLVNQPSFIGEDSFWLGFAYIFIAMIGWGIATIYLKQITLPKSKGLSIAIQMLGGGLVMLIYSLVSGEYLGFSSVNLTAKGIYAWLYLVFFGSILAFSSFNYLLYKTTPDKVSSSTFVNPVVALLLGFLFNNEIISSQSFWAAIILLIGVVFIVKNKSKHG